MGFSSCQTAQMRGLSRLAISGSSLPFLTACVDLCYLRGNQGFSLVWQDYNSHRRSYERAEYKTASYSLPCCGLKGFETDNGGRTRGTVAPMKRIFGKLYEQRFGLFSTLFVFNKTFSNLDFIFFFLIKKLKFQFLYFNSGRGFQIGWMWVGEDRQANPSPKSCPSALTHPRLCSKCMKFNN